MESPVRSRSDQSYGQKSQNEMISKWNSMEEKYTEKVFSIPIATENRASLLINELCPKKATGSDGIPVKFIKLFKFALIPILVLIMNL